MMPGWNEIVRRELAGLALELEERREVVAELAAHLEETCEAMLRQGVSEDEALRRTLLQAGDWRHLRLRIQSARSKEGSVTDRVRQWWLPGFVALFLSMMLLMANEFMGIKPLIVSAHGSQRSAPVAVIYVPWLLLLVPIGAMAAYLAGRAGGSQRAMFVSTVFPVLPHLGFFLIVFPVVLILDDHVAHNIMISGLFMSLAAWVVLPGVALLAGGLPTQLLVSRRQGPRRIASA